MFMIHLLRWLFGWIRLEAEGGFPERLLNLAAREGIELWGVRRYGIKLTASCPARQYRMLRSPARRAGMRLHVKKRHGVPFTLHRYRSRSGLLVGLTLFIVILQLFSQRIWIVEVRGSKKVDKEKILGVMQEFGVREGADLSNLDIPTLQLQTLRKLPELAWCVVNLQGSIAYVDVTERISPPELSNPDRPSNIKAARDGRIISIEVYTGQSMVQKGDAVAQGMLLVSGIIESSVGPILKRSQARILAQTVRVLEVSVPLKEKQLLATGERILRPCLHIFTLNIPMFTDGKIEQQNKLSITRNMLNVNGISLPLGIICKSYELMEYRDIVRTESQAKELAKKRLKEKKKELAGVEIIKENEKGELKNGRYVLSGVYDCIEDICMEEELVIE